VLRWLPTSDAVEFLTFGDSQGAQLHAQANAIRARLDELGKAFVAGEIDRQQMKEGTGHGKAKLEARLAALSGASALSGLAGHADAAQRWEGLSTDRRRAVIDAVWSITLNPSKRGGRGGTKFVPRTVTVTKRPTAA
jgi:site-specific DNA recombinase